MQCATMHGIRALRPPKAPAESTGQAIFKRYPDLNMEQAPCANFVGYPLHQLPSWECDQLMCVSARKGVIPYLVRTLI